MRIFGLDFSKKKAISSPELQRAMMENLNRLVIQIDALTARQDTLEGEQVKLRNQFNGAKGGRPRQSEQRENAAPIGDRDQLRAYARSRGFKI